MNTKKILEELIVDIGNNVDISQYSGKLQVFSRLLGNDSFTKWINQEYIYGYDADSELPSYRKIRAIQLIASYTSPTMKCTRVPIPIINQGRVVYEETMLLKLRDSIKLIAKAIESSHENITYSVNPHTLCLVQKEIGYAQITESYFEFSKQDFRKVVDISNAKLIDMLMDLNKELFNGDFDFNSMDNQKRQAIVNNIYASNVHMGSGNIETTNSNNIGGCNNTGYLSSDLRNEIQEIIRRIENIKANDDADKNDIAEEIFAIKEELNKESPSKTLLKRSLRALKTIGSIAQEKVIEHGIDQILSSLIV